MKKCIGAFAALLLTTLFFVSCSKEAPQTNDASVLTSEKKTKAETAAKAMTVAAKPTLEIGDKAPMFDLKNVDGQMVSFKNYPDAKGYIVTFTCNHCPYSVLYEDRLIDLHNEMAPKGYPVIAINPNDPAVQPEDSYDLMKVRSEEKKFPFAYLFDESQTVYPQYGASRTPHVFLVDKNMVVQYIGAIDNNAKDAEAATVNYVKDAIDALENGKKPDPNFTKAIGCTIKKKA